jgi:hypothetical protein
MKKVVVAFAVVAFAPAAMAQIIKDPPWNPEHLDRLPAPVRSAVLARCSTRPDADHYFATYLRDEIHLHYEHLHCGGTNYCNASGCLHQIYRLSGGNYRLEKSVYGSAND